MRKTFTRAFVYENCVTIRKTKIQIEDSRCLPEGYLYELNQVAAITSESIVYLRRKFVSSSGWELVKYPLSDCFEIHYEQDLSFARIISGVLLCAFIVAIVAALFIYGESLEASTKMPTSRSHSPALMASSSRWAAVAID